jgi:hypothetical protein
MALSTDVRSGSAGCALAPNAAHVRAAAHEITQACRAARASSCLFQCADFTVFPLILELFGFGATWLVLIADPEMVFFGPIRDVLHSFANYVASLAPICLEGAGWNF